MYIKFVCWNLINMTKNSFFFLRVGRPEHKFCKYRNKNEQTLKYGDQNCRFESMLIKINQSREKP